MTIELKKIIENIKRAKLLELKNTTNLADIIIQIKQAKNQETETTKELNGSIKSVFNELQQIIANIKKAKKNEQLDIGILSKSIENIKQSFQKNWHEEHLPYIKHVSSAIKNGLPTPVLTVCGKGTMEIRFSRYLAYFLDPSKKHGLGGTFLKTVLREETQSFGKDWFEHCRVYHEYWLGIYNYKSGKKIDCYCDIAVIGDEFACIIEQKILSSEDTGGSSSGTRQLRRYSMAISNNPEFSNKVIIKIYLTPTGKMGGEIDGWSALSHEDLISRATKLLAEDNLTNTAKENLRRLLIDLSIGPYQKTEKNIDEIEKTADLLLDKGFNLSLLLKFRRLVNNNRKMIKVITEGLIWKS